MHTRGENAEYAIAEDFEQVQSDLRDGRTQRDPLQEELDREKGERVRESQCICTWVRL